MRQPKQAEHILKYWDCGLPVDDGHFHVTFKGAVDCISRQEKAVKSAGEKSSWYPLTNSLCVSDRCAERQDPKGLEPKATRTAAIAATP